MSLTSMQQKRFVWVIQLSYVCYLSGAISKITNVILSLSINVKKKNCDVFVFVCVCVYFYDCNQSRLFVLNEPHIYSIFLHFFIHQVCQIWNKMHFVHAVEHMPRVALYKMRGTNVPLLFIECNVSCHIQ